MAAKELFMIPGLDKSGEIQALREKSMRKSLTRLERIQKARAERNGISRVMEVRKSF